MDRPKRVANKVSDYRKYHLSGDLDETLQGRVDTRVNQFEMAKSNEELQKQLEEERAQSKRIMDEMEHMKIEHELEMEKLKQKQWQVAMDQLKEAREHAEKEHHKYLKEIKDLAGTARDNTTRSMLEWFKSQADQLGKPGGAPDNEAAEKARLEQEAKDREIKELQSQQEDIARKLAQLTNSTPQQNPEGQLLRPTQDLLLEQLRGTLTSEKDDDPNKALLRALLTNQNKAPGEGGTNALKPALINSLIGNDSSNMAE